MKKSIVRYRKKNVSGDESILRDYGRKMFKFARHYLYSAVYYSNETQTFYPRCANGMSLRHISFRDVGFIFILFYFFT